MANKEKVMVVFGKTEPAKIEAFDRLPKPIEKIAFDIDELLKWFKSYEVDSIELSIEGTVKTGGVLNLIVSAEGTGGMKVTLKPKK